MRCARRGNSCRRRAPHPNRERSKSDSRAHCMRSTTRLVWPRSRPEKGELGSVPSGSDDERAAGFCAEVMRHAVVIADEVGALPDAPDRAAPVEALDWEKEVAAPGAPTEQTMV